MRVNRRKKKRIVKQFFRELLPMGFIFFSYIYIMVLLCSMAMK